MNVDGVTNGIVIDHIKAGRSLEIYRLLDLDSVGSSLAIIKNVSSSKYGNKDIIKIDEEIDIDLDALGYLDPHITVNIIKDGRLLEKKHLALPLSLRNVILCKNPRCITTTEQEIDHIFRLTDRERGIYRCIYCETQAKGRE